MLAGGAWQIKNHNTAALSDRCYESKISPEFYFKTATAQNRYVRKRKTEAELFVGEMMRNTGTHNENEVNSDI